MLAGRPPSRYVYTSKPNSGRLQSNNFGKLKKVDERSGFAILGRGTLARKYKHVNAHKIPKFLCRYRRTGTHVIEKLEVGKYP